MKQFIAIIISLSLLILSISCTNKQALLVVNQPTNPILFTLDSYKQTLEYLDQKGYKVKNVIAGFNEQKTYIKLLVYRKESVGRVMALISTAVFCLPCSFLFFKPNLNNPKTFVIVLEERR